MTETCPACKGTGSTHSRDGAAFVSSRCSLCQGEGGIPIDLFAEIAKTRGVTPLELKTEIRDYWRGDEDDASGEML